MKYLFLGAVVLSLLTTPAWGDDQSAQSAGAQAVTNFGTIHHPVYSNYIARQQKDVDALRRDEAQIIPKDFEYSDVDSLSNEMKQKLIQIKPHNLAQAGRIEGMTPAALTLLLAKLRQRKRA